MIDALQPAAPVVKIYPDGRLDARATSAYTGLSLKSLAVMRCNGNGPAFFKLGKSVFYSRDDLDAWIAGNRARSTAEFRAKRNAA